MFFYYANKLKKEMNLNTIFFSMNWLKRHISSLDLQM